MLILILLISSPLVYSQTVTVSCPNGWIVFDNNCLFIGQSYRTWDDARTFCSGQGATLWNVENIQEFESVMPQTIGGALSWIGLRNLGMNEGNKWDGPTTFSYDVLPWANKYPGHGMIPTLAECVAAYGAQQPSALYTNFYNCASLFNFICKKTGSPMAAEANFTRQ